MTSLDGKVALITGGARGVGEEVARRLHAKGAKLVLTDLDQAPLTELAGELGPDRVLTAVADVNDLSAMQAAVDQAVARFGGIDIVMANAGIATYGSVLNVNPAAFRTLIDVNVIGVFNTVRAALPSIIDRRGYMLIVSSAAAFAASPGSAAYNTSKAAVEHFANTVRLEVAHHGVDVGSAHMLWIDTPLDKCAAAFVKGIEERRSRIYCPDWLGLMRWLKPLLSTRLGEGPVRKTTPELLPQMGAEVAGLGRSMSARTEALETE